MIWRIQTHWCVTAAVSHRKTFHILHPDHLFVPFLVSLLTIIDFFCLLLKLRTRGDSLWSSVLFLTCGSRAVVAWRWGCHQRASSAGETVSRFWSPASGRSSDRSYAPGSPYTRCALTPGSPAPHKENERERKREIGRADVDKGGKKCDLIVLAWLR